MASSSLLFLCFILSSSFLMSFAPLGVEGRVFTISSFITEDLFKAIFLHKDNTVCPAKDFYTYYSFVQATQWNYNYGPAGEALGFDGLKNPELVSNNSLIAFKAALWFWMTEQKPKPLCHDMMIGRYQPMRVYLAANRTAGFGLVTNIINGGLECGRPGDASVNDRIGYYQRYAKLFNVDTDPNLD